MAPSRPRSPSPRRTGGQADALGISAYKAEGAPFTTDGFNCKANAEGPGSEWARAWGGTYYPYKAGLVQVAFNWGELYIG